MKRFLILAALSVSLSGGVAHAQEQTPELRRMLEIVESGRGVLLLLNGALDPLPETAVQPEPVEDIEDPLLDPMAEEDVIESAEPVEVDALASTTLLEDDIEAEEAVEMEAPAAEVMIEEAEADLPVAPSAPDEPADLSMPLQTAAVELGDPASIGPYRLWLASYRNKSEAQAGWEQMVKENPVVLASLVPVLVLKELGDGAETFFRLQAGPLQSALEAEAACQSLQDIGLYCTVLGPES